MVEKKAADVSTQALLGPFLITPENWRQYDEAADRGDANARIMLETVHTFFKRMKTERFYCLCVDTCPNHDKAFLSNRMPCAFLVMLPIGPTDGSVIAAPVCRHCVQQTGFPDTAAQTLLKLLLRDMDFETLSIPAMSQTLH